MGRAVALCCSALVAVQTPLSLLDVPFISQSEALCGGASAAMVLRYWGERGISAETFSALVDRSAAGIRTDVLIADLQRRGWTARGGGGDETTVRRELSRGRPVVVLIEDRPSVFHYIVVVGWHDRGVVFHDPARGPFVVMSTSDFSRKWRAARRWTGVILPGPDRTGAEDVEGANSVDEAVAAPLDACEQVVARGVSYAQANDLDAAERTLAAAVGCPAAARELAGIRVLQKRWPEAEALASTAVAANAGDAYAWKVLATARFIRNDSVGALKAWNQAGEPRLDLVRVDGLTRTRIRVVEDLLDADIGRTLTAEAFVRSRRRLAALPAASSTRLEYVPVPGGLAELRSVVAERPLVPGAPTLVAIALVGAITREVQIATGSLLGSGEQISASWRFWHNRRRVAAGLRAPSPWGGVWAVDAYTERQSFVGALVPAERTGVQLSTSDWLTGRLRWSVAAGADRWQGEPMRPRLGGRLQLASQDDRAVAAIEVSTWMRDRAFGTVDGGLRLRSSNAPRGFVAVGAANLQLASARTPLDVWWAADTGQARPTLARAHPVLDDGRLKPDRLGRVVGQASVEAQRWWRVAGPVSTAAAAFGDFVRTMSRYEGSGRGDVDLGLGIRVAVTGIRGIFRADVGKGLADGATAFSVTYDP